MESGEPQQGQQAPSVPQPPPPAPPAGQAPVAAGTAAVAATQQGQISVRDSAVTWLLCIFIPLYLEYWWYKMNEELGAWSGGRIEVNPLRSTLAILPGSFVIIPPFITVAHTMGRIRAAQEMAGVEPRASFWGYVGRSFLFGYSAKWVQDQLNELAERRPA